MAQALFKYELEENVEEYIESKRADNDKYIVAVTEHTNDVAMVLIDENDTLHINEDARAMLKKLWQKAYKKNLQLLIPDMAAELDRGYLWYVGVKVSDDLLGRRKVK